MDHFNMENTCYDKNVFCYPFLALRLLSFSIYTISKSKIYPTSVVASMSQKSQHLELICAYLKDFQEIGCKSAVF